MILKILKNLWIHCKIFEHDYRVIDVSDGSKALECLSEEYPDLILSDVMMPGIQGDELCRIVKENPQTSGIPFILLTAKVTHDAMVNGLKSGADDYIPKPFSARNHLREYVLKNVVAQIEKNETVAIDTLNSKDEIRQTDGGNVQNDAVPVSEDDLNFIKHATQLVMDNMDDEEFNINQLCQEMAMSRTLFYVQETIWYIPKQVPGAKLIDCFIFILRADKSINVHK